MFSSIRTDRKSLRKELLTTLKIGGPVIIAQLLQMSMTFVDTVMAGNLSAKDLAAISVGGAIYFPFIMLAGGVLMALTPVIAQLSGGRRFGEIGKNARQGLWVSQMLALPIFFAVRHLGALMEWMAGYPGNHSRRSRVPRCHLMGNFPPLCLYGAPLFL